LASHTNHSKNRSGQPLVSPQDGADIRTQPGGQQLVLSASLADGGMAVVRPGKGESALQAAVRHRADLVVLELLLPGVDGWHILDALRAGQAAKIIVLTTLRDEPSRVRGLEHGADDYVTKPFNAQELLLRARALLRRAGSWPAAADGILTDGDVRLDLRSHRAWRGGKTLVLTAREHSLLSFFLQNSGATYTRSELLERVWGWRFGDESTVTAHVRRLRLKIEDDASRPRRLVTVWGMGYCYKGEQGRRGLGVV